MRSESIKRLRLVAVRGAFPALACVVAYAVTPARADALPDPVEEVPRQLAFSGYAEVAGSPAQGTRRVRHIVWADATTNTYANALFIEEKDETFAGGVFTATLDDCTFQPDILAPAIANAFAQLSGGKRLRHLPMLPESVKSATVRDASL